MQATGNPAPNIPTRATAANPMSTKYPTRPLTPAEKIGLEQMAADIRIRAATAQWPDDKLEMELLAQHMVDCATSPTHRIPVTLTHLKLPPLPAKPSELRSSPAMREKLPIRYFDQTGNCCEGKSGHVSVGASDAKRPAVPASPALKAIYAELIRKSTITAARLTPLPPPLPVVVAPPNQPPDPVYSKLDALKDITKVLCKLALGILIFGILCAISLTWWGQLIIAIMFGLGYFALGEYRWPGLYSGKYRRRR